MNKETINSACFIDGKLFINKKEVVEDIEEWMYRLRIVGESLIIKQQNKTKMNKKKLKELTKEIFDGLNYKDGRLKIENMNLPYKIKELALDTFELWWDYRNWTPESEGFDWKAAEGVASSLMLIILKFEKKDEDEQSR